MSTLDGFVIKDPVNDQIKEGSAHCANNYIPLDAFAKYVFTNGAIINIRTFHHMVLKLKGNVQKLFIHMIYNLYLAN